jgi:hypothetical protein
MPKFVIEPHFRLQEWIAEEQGYFTAEGLDYEFREKIRSTGGQHHDMGGQRVGAYQSFEEGRSADVSCACHWTVNVAASSAHGRLYADLYSVAPAGIFVAADSPIRDPADLAGVPISVGWQSGSHYSTIQALEPYLPAGKTTCPSPRGCCSAAWRCWSTAGPPRLRCSAAPIISPSSSASAKLSTRVS